MVEVAYIFFCHAGDEENGSPPVKDQNHAPKENTRVTTIAVAWVSLKCNENDIDLEGESIAVAKLDWMEVKLFPTARA